MRQHAVAVRMTVPHIHMEVPGAVAGLNKRASEAHTSDEHTRDRAVDAVRDHEREAAKSFAHALRAYHGTLAPRWDFHPPPLASFQLPRVALSGSVESHEPPGSGALSHEVWSLILANATGALQGPDRGPTRAASLCMLT